MNKKAILALMLAVILPLASYLVMGYFGKSATQMPARYFPDSVISRQQQGKIVSDTVWHSVADFRLLNQAGDTVTLQKYKGKVIVADFFFTRCPTICPALTQNMRLVQQAVTNAHRVGDKTNHNVQFISFSIDPERDSVPALKKWADRFQVNPEQWDLLTGDKQTIYDLALRDLKLGLVDGKGIDTSFIHTDHFVLIDSARQVRGYYHGLDSADLQRLLHDMVLLTLEKKPGKKSMVADKLRGAAIALLIAAAAAGVFLMIFKKQKNAETRFEEE